jgi:hypothetical protein
MVQAIAAAYHISGQSGQDSSRQSAAPFIQVELTSTPKQKPVFDHSLPFGKVFTDHMLEIEWSKQQGFSTPRIVPYRMFRPQYLCHIWQATF